MDLDFYQRARTASVWRDMSHFGRFMVSGADASHLLHHLTTNDIKALSPGEGCNAVLLTNKARVLDRLLIFHVAPTKYLVVTSPNRRQLFQPHAQKFILFRQDVTMQEITGQSALWGLFGAETLQVQSALGLGSWEQVPTHCHGDFECNQTLLTACRTDRLPAPGLLVWSSDIEGLGRLVLSSAAPRLDDSTYNVLRIERGIPVAGLELTEEVNPWEAGLDADISLNKGCYNGQEVVARLHSYKKIKQKLTGFRLERMLMPGEQAGLICAGKAAGKCTSSVTSPEFGSIGLGYVRNSASTHGQELHLISSNLRQTVELAKLPFERSQRLAPDS